MSKLKNTTIFTGTNDILNPDVYVLKEKAEKIQALVNNDINASKARLNDLIKERDQLTQSHQNSINELIAKIEIALGCKLISIAH